MRPFLVYTACRVGIFAALTGLLWLLGLDGLVLLLAAVVLSLPVSFLLLSRQRAALGRDVERRISARRSNREQLRSRLRGDGPPAGAGPEQAPR